MNAIKKKDDNMEGNYHEQIGKSYVKRELKERKKKKKKVEIDNGKA